MGSSSGGAKWRSAQKDVSFRLYRPTRTLGLGLNTFGRGCAGKRVWATYGSYHGDQAKGHGFQVIEAWPSLCPNPNRSRPLGHYTVDGRTGRLGVYCRSGHRCNGFRKGFTFFVRMRSSGGRRTLVFLDSAHLRKRQFLAVVRSLRRVRR